MRASTKMAIALALAAALFAAYRLGGRQAAPASANPRAGEAAARKLLYYRNPMGQPDTSPVPKKDWMGMDYIAVYDDEEEVKGQVAVAPGKMQKLGVRTEAAALRELSRAVRATGRIEVDEWRVHTVAPKFEGWIERLEVGATGAPVTAGQTLFWTYSPELVSVQQEYAIAARGLDGLKDGTEQARAGMRALAEASLARLANWDVAAADVERLKQGGEVKRALPVRSPASGVVIEKKAVAGNRFTPGEALYQIADLSSVWILADVFEQDLARVKLGQGAKITVNAYPGREFAARVDFIAPTMNAQTRTTALRLQLANPGGLLKPAMYASVELATGKSRVLAVPLSAVLATGRGQTLLVEVAEGRFAPREVKLGLRGDDYVEVTEGLVEGERVVVAANFLIDSESNLKAALGGFTPAAEAK